VAPEERWPQQPRGVPEDAAATEQVGRQEGTQMTTHMVRQEEGRKGRGGGAGPVAAMVTDRGCREGLAATLEGDRGEGG
jgi:hypothetical protein